MSKPNFHVPFILEKKPNLLCCTLLLPLLPIDAEKELAEKLAQQLGVAKSSGCLPKVQRSPVIRRPHLKVTSDSDRGASIVSVYYYAANGSLEEYCRIQTDCLLDINGSTLALHGDHLAARLTFKNYFTARDARESRNFLRFHPAEFDSDFYASQGILCRSCGSAIVAPSVITSLRRAPSMPWSELIECLTCVPAEEYRSLDSADPAFAFDIDVWTFNSGSVLVDEGHISLLLSADSAAKIDSSPNTSLILSTGDDGGKHEQDRRNLYCKNCEAWLGAGCLKENAIEASLCKFRLRVAELFDQYSIESSLCAAVMKAATARECYRFLVGFCDTDETFIAVIKIILISHDTWIMTNDRIIKPVLKFLFWEKDDSSTPDFVEWSKRTSAEYVRLPNNSSCQDILRCLDRSNHYFPHSMRRLPDDSRLGYLETR